ncbi:MAG: SHOCT domain-containing protein [Deltaproteobacteria bacterium]|uniref:SHOCT domain-containing protein n=1 Tax=Desulfobacula sp. TaxID=2593537 RepID=UPI0019989D96|nr:SHOCT domain-containing protein [Candidatus Desulfobacula maris]MBL6993332.1 SHOCT domain-containing protein [Desulfobacula sp.]
MKIKTSLFFVLLSAFFLLSAHDAAFAGWGDNSYGYSGGHMMGGAGYMGWFMIIFWGLLLIALIFLIRWISHLPLGKEAGQGADKKPLDILKERLARGEIEIDEYREKKQLLS